MTFFMQKLSFMCTLILYSVKSVYSTSRRGSGYFFHCWLFVYICLCAYDDTDLGKRQFCSFCNLYWFIRILQSDVGNLFRCIFMARYISVSNFFNWSLYFSLFCIEKCLRNNFLFLYIFCLGVQCLKITKSNRTWFFLHYKSFIEI